MNVKKTGGVGKAVSSLISKIVEEQKDFILRQLNLIEADVILLCTRFDPLIRQLFQPEENWIDSGYEIRITKWKNSKILDFYHRSSRNVSAAAYSLLQNILNSKFYKDI